MRSFSGLDMGQVPLSCDFMLHYVSCNPECNFANFLLSVLASDILQNDFNSLEMLRTAFPTFIRDYAMWKRCYSADHSSWSTADFHSNCDAKGPSLTIIRVRDYVFGGFVEQSWGGRWYKVCVCYYGAIGPVCRM